MVNNFKNQYSVLTEAEEFSELPVRHNEDNLNEHLAGQLPIQVDNRHYDAASVKAHLLLQCHMHRGTLPSSDYLLDTKTVMDNAARVIQLGVRFFERVISEIIFRFESP